MISIWHRCNPPRDEYVLAVTPKASHYTNIGIVKPKGLINVFELRDGGYVFLNEVKMWCRSPQATDNKKTNYEEQTQNIGFIWRIEL